MEDGCGERRSGRLRSLSAQLRQGGTGAHGRSREEPRRGGGGVRGDAQDARDMNADNPRQGGDDSGLPSNREKDSDEWVTGDERMTGARASYLKTLCEEAKEAFDPNMTKAEASRRIDELQRGTGCGRPADAGHGDDRGGGRDEG